MVQASGEPVLFLQSSEVGFSTQLGFIAVHIPLYVDELS